VTVPQQDRLSQAGRLSTVLLGHCKIHRWAAAQKPKGTRGTKLKWVAEPKQQKFRCC